MSSEPDCNHSFTLLAGLGGTVKVCGKCGWTVRVNVVNAASGTKH